MSVRRAVVLIAVVIIAASTMAVGVGSASGAVGRTAVGDRITYWFAADSKRVYATAYNIFGLKAEFYSLDRELRPGGIQRRFDTTVILPGQRVSSTISSPDGYAACAIAVNGRIRSQKSVFHAHQIARCY
ncbi:hypothetical protein [Gordonia amicalis]|uniref:hypothetical protein n=1 Tax=Gordonia amicalis TaxID=89053 RepID=UPI0015F6E8C0|nr:hypothetical protein [Gordonia amicalis]MBA5846330.1 hypothetical protein [Gordonia amicalis]